MKPIEPKGVVDDAREGRYSLVVATVSSAGASVPVSKGVDDATECSLFEIGSLTKLVTATMLAALVEQGHVALDDPLHAFFGAMPCGDVTLGALATHTSGLPRLPPDITRVPGHSPQDPYRGYTAAALVAALSAVDAPTARFEYSNFGYMILAHALERAAGATFAELATSLVFRPLDMATATVDDGVHHHHDSRCLPGYRHNRPTSFWTHTVPGAGGVKASPADMQRFLAAAVQPEDSPLARALAMAQETRVEGSPCSLGWHHLGGVRWHNGGTAGFSCFLGVHTVRRQGLIILSNRGAPSPMIDRAGLRSLMTSWYGDRRCHSGTWTQCRPLLQVLIREDAGHLYYCHSTCAPSPSSIQTRAPQGSGASGR